MTEQPDPNTGPSRRASALAGGAAGLLALAVLWALSQLTGLTSFPPFDLAERLVRLTPGDVATASIESLGHLGMPLFVGSVAAGVVGLAAALPVLAARFGRSSTTAMVTFGVALGLMVVIKPSEELGVDTAIAALVGGAAYGVALRFAQRRPADTASGDAMSRRAALGVIGSAAVTLFVAGSIFGRLLNTGSPTAGTPIATPDVPLRTPERSSFPKIPGMEPEITSVADHYVVDIDVVDPIVDVDSWTLKVSGLVEQPREYDFEELQAAFPVIEQYSVLTCISNEVGGPLIGNSAWRGIRLADLLREVAPTAEADSVVFTCADGYSVTVPLQRAMEPSNLVAFGQNGEPLSTAHGAPVRVRIPALYGMLNAKWLTGIELVSGEPSWYWSERGWSQTGVIKTQSRIDVVEPRAAGQAGRIAGIAWAGERGVQRVQASVDDGKTWEDAKLRELLSPLSWTQWYIDWTPERAGAYTISCRAVDGAGEVQVALNTPPHPDGATGYQMVTQTIS
ncbi:MAG: molybdopterin-dependent oxidoreductase [Thermoleophilaceae bacterium]|nr:molybdopterin-dependent oxidoreductase [Thermoleophilaceae bacterium]